MQKVGRCECVSALPSPAGANTATLLTQLTHAHLHLPHPCRAAILAVYVAESLLLAFALKLRVGAALAGQRGAKAAVPAACAALGLDDGTFHRAASFLGQCMPTYVQQPGASRPALKVRRQAEGGGAGCLLHAVVPVQVCSIMAAGCFWVKGHSIWASIAALAVQPPTAMRRCLLRRRAPRARRCSGWAKRAWAGCPPAATWWPCSASACAWSSTGRCAGHGQDLGCLKRVPGVFCL